MVSYLFTGVLIGLVFGLPVGAIGALTMQRAWSFGLKAGLLTGLGSSVADCLYAVVGAFGLTLISDFLLQYQANIHAVGGALILIMGIQLLFKKGDADLKEAKAVGKVKMFLSSFVIGITNPAAIITFLFAFSYFGIAGVARLSEGVALVCGVFIGTYLWWWAISLATITLKKRATKLNLCIGNKIFGSILTIFATFILVSSFYGGIAC